MSGRIYPNWPFIAVIALCFAVPAVLDVADVNPRPLSAIVGFLAFLLLCYRFAESYRITPTIARAAVLLVLISLLLGAIGSTQLANTSAPLTVVAYPLLAQRIACLMFAVYYHLILDLETRNPWVKHRR